VEGATFLAFLALGPREDFSAGPYVEGCLGDTFLLPTDFMKEDMVGFEVGSAGALSLLTTGV